MGGFRVLGFAVGVVFGVMCFVVWIGGDVVGVGDFVFRGLGGLVWVCVIWGGLSCLLICRGFDFRVGLMVLGFCFIVVWWFCNVLVWSGLFWWVGLGWGVWVWVGLGFGDLVFYWWIWVWTLLFVFDWFVCVTFGLGLMCWVVCFGLFCFLFFEVGVFVVFWGGFMWFSLVFGFCTITRCCGLGV